MISLLPAVRPEPARRLWLPFLLPSFNELEAARGVFADLGHGRRMNGYHQLKKTHQATAVAFLRRGRPMLTGRVVVACRWVERDRKRDPDNVSGGGAKIINDALGPGRGGRRGWPGAGVLHCDGWHCIAGFVHAFDVDPRNPGVEVLLYEVTNGDA